MQLDKAGWSAIVGRSSTVPERLAGRTLYEPETDLAEARLTDWCERVANGDLERFRKRLVWDGWAPEPVRTALGSIRQDDGQALPAWVMRLSDVLQAGAQVAAGGWDNWTEQESAVLEAGHPIPFEHVLIPFVRVARERLVEEVGAGYDYLSPKAQAKLERWLMRRLAEPFSLALGVSFEAVRELFRSVAALLPDATDGANVGLYRNFVLGMLRDEMPAFFSEYPVLARLSATLIEYWVEASAEFIKRLEGDWAEIERIFAGGQDLGRVADLQPGLSDHHHQGRSVIILAFDSGSRLVYKPRDLGLETAYYSLLSWLSSQGSPLPFRLLATCNRPSYGWMEYVEQNACDSPAEAKRFFQRAGMLLFLLFALNGTDFHSENLIASGEHPMLVDLEMLFCHRFRELPRSGGDDHAQYSADKQMWDSVLRTGLLPSWIIGEDGSAFDPSGLASAGGQTVPIPMPQWKEINTDQMSWEYKPGQTRTLANLPTLNGHVLSVNDYATDLIDGFRQMGTFVRDHREAILAEDGPLAAFTDLPVRAVLRPTMAYASLLSTSFQPQYLRDGADRYVHLDIVSRAAMTSEDIHPYWPLLRVEHQALWNMDIPFFGSRTGTYALPIGPDLELQDFFEEPSYDAVVERIRTFGELDLERQLGFIRGSLHARFAEEVHPGALRSGQGPSDLDTGAILSSSELVEQAVVLAVALQRQAIWGGDGSATWIGHTYKPHAQRYQLEPIGHSLYAGGGGVALFLAALTAVTGDSAFRELSLSALHHLRQMLADPPESRALADEMGIGGASGLGSAIYALVQSGGFLDDASLVDDARIAADLITPARIANDKVFDVIAGAAGAALGLLKLYGTTGDSSILDRAAGCGQHLLANRVTSAAGHLTWEAPQGEHLTGFSHGAAGIAYALLKLAKATGDAAFDAAAREAIFYERAVFSPEARNWPDLRRAQPANDEQSFMTSWCHGATGIGLARLGSLGILDDDEVKQEVEVALGTTLSSSLNGVDHLCCGNMGRIEFLLTAGNLLDRPQLREGALRRASWVVARAQERWGFRLFDKAVTGFINPGFFQGIAGIGYQLLRLSSPDMLPSVLMWE